jgi:hypothetical protein
MDQRRVILVMRRQRQVRRVIQLNLPSFDSFVGAHPPAEYNKIRFRLLCQNQMLTPAQLQAQNVPTIAFDADELHFETWMSNLRDTPKTHCDQCGHSPASWLPDPILEHYPALRGTGWCPHSICVFCLREKFRNVSATIRCQACSKIFLVNSASAQSDQREFNSQSL